MQNNSVLKRRKEKVLLLQLWNSLERVLAISHCFYFFMTLFILFLHSLKYNVSQKIDDIQEWVTSFNKIYFSFYPLTISYFLSVVINMEMHNTFIQDLAKSGQIPLHWFQVRKHVRTLIWAAYPPLYSGMCKS